MIIQANALTIPLKDESVQCVVTSPPYWGLRDYGTATWEGGKNGCDHIVGEIRTGLGMAALSEKYRGGGKKVSEPKPLTAKKTCPKCGAKRIDNQFGLEKTPEEYVENTVTWAREVWRVLRKDGTFWLNLGDSYVSNPSGKGEEFDNNFRCDERKTLNKIHQGAMTRRPNNLKPKDLCEIPSDVVRALRKDGWWLRSRLPWVKRSAMPESCTDRPASALEYMFLLTKSQKYFFDMDAIRKNYQQSSIDRVDGTTVTTSNPDRPVGFKRELSNNGRNFRNTDLFYQSLEEPHGAIFCGEEMVGLDVNPQPYSEAHFATFPEWLVTPLIKSGTSEKGACPECGAPWIRILSKSEGGTTGKSWQPHIDDEVTGNSGGNHGQKIFDSYVPSKTIGWQPSCKCGIAHPNPTYIPKPLSFVPHEPVPCIVLDNFGGSGTVKNVAERVGRKAIVMDLKYEYCLMAKKRCESNQESLEL